MPMPLPKKKDKNSCYPLSNTSYKKKPTKYKKKETRVCPTCQKKTRHLGYRKKNIESSHGTLRLSRLYHECGPCSLLEHPAEAILGLVNYTVGFRFLAVRAGSRGSYEEAKEDLKVWRGLDVSHETIRMLCHQEAPKVQQFVEQSAEVPKDFIAAKGNVEILMDATKVNTLLGWRDAKIGIFSKRLLGQSVDLSYWDKRNRSMLPDVNSCAAFAAIEEKELFQKRVNHFRYLLRVGSTGDISALGDGAEWIWNIIREVFGNVRECLDIYHALEHLSNTGKVLYKEGTAEYERRREETKRELLASGFEKIEKRLDEWDVTLSDDRKREAVRKLRNDLSGHSERLGYRERLGEGRVIGSGQVEGACKSMIGLCYWGWGAQAERCSVEGGQA